MRIGRNAPALPTIQAAKMQNPHTDTVHGFRKKRQAGRPCGRCLAQWPKNTDERSVAAGTSTR